MLQLAPSLQHVVVVNTIKHGLHLKRITCDYFVAVELYFKSSSWVKVLRKAGLENVRCIGKDVFAIHKRDPCFKVDILI